MIWSNHFFKGYDKTEAASDGSLPSRGVRLELGADADMVDWCIQLAEVVCDEKITSRGGANR